MSCCHGCVQYQSSLTDNLNSITSVFGGLMTAVGSAEKVFQWMDRKPTIIDEGNVKPQQFIGRIEFQHVGN